MHLPNRLLVVPLCLAVVSGCNGTIDGDPDAGNGSNYDADVTVVGDTVLVGDTPVSAVPTPERKTLHRLNRAEYDNSIREVFFGLDLKLAEDFPADDHGAGFDNIADSLALSPLTLELYERAADKVVTEALHQPVAEPAFINVEAEDAETSQSTGGESGDFWNLWSNGTVSTVVQLPADGTYALSARVACQQAGPETCIGTLMLDGLDIQAFDITGTNSAPDVITVNVTTTAGGHTIGVAFTNDYYDAALGEDQNMLVDWVRIEGPSDLPPTENPVRNQILALCTSGSVGDEVCIREIATAFGKRAWRRPLGTAEVDTLMGLATQVAAAGGGWEDQLALVLKALILSPHFLFRVELDEPPTSPEVHALTDYELASRLAYFLWSSPPDTELMTLADQGQLQDAAVIATQVERMLEDPRAQALVDNFAGQWLFIRAVPDQAPDVWYYPDYDDPLQAAQETELRMFAERYLFEDRDMLDMLTDTETWVNQRLASHYGLPTMGLTNDAFEQVDLAGTGRKGLFGKSGLMTVLSHPTRTSPVKRGVWVLEQLMCDGPPDPPPGVEGLLDEADPTGKTLRELMEQHRADPYCASCHDTIDPIGLGLENYGGDGAWRDLDNDLPVDASGELPGGLTFDGPDGMIQHLLTDPRFTHCIAEKAYIYAMGRDVLDTDEGFLVAIENAFKASGHRFKALATSIATSDAFRMRRGEPEPSTGGQP